MCCRQKMARHWWFIAVLLTQSVVTFTYAQGRCETIYNEGHAIANCSNRGFDYIPWDLHHDIRTLDLSDNNFSELRANSFDKYVNIEKLFLSGNQLKVIQNGAFSKLNRLKVLDLSQNQFHAVPTKALSDVPNLNSLSMKGNRLNGLEKDAFQGLPFLRTLNLAANHINVIAPFTFSGLDLLTSLELHDNALQSLSYEVVSQFTYDLKIIKLYNNPWFCDCRLQWLVKWLNNGTVLHGLQWNVPGLEPRCAGPSMVQNKAFTRVPLEEFACPIEMYTSGSRITLKRGDSTALYCKYFSITESSVVWFKDNDQIKNDSHFDKYRIVESGEDVKQSVLNIFDFQPEDQAEYRCLAENIRGTDYIKFDVSFETIQAVSPKELATPEKNSENNEKIIIALSIVAGFIVLIIIVCLVIRSIVRIRKRQEEKRDEIRMQLKHHELETTNKEKSQDELDGDESYIDETMTKLRPDDRESIQSDNFSHIYGPTPANGNTYISFSSELTEPDDISQIYSAIRNPPPPPGSHTESTTPLLDYYTPSLYESDEPIYDTRAYSVASVNVPNRTNYYIAHSYSPRTPGSTRSNQFPDEDSIDNPYSNRPYHDIPDYSDVHNYSDIRDYNQPDFIDYSDYRDVYKLPCSPAPNSKTLNSKRSASVGHLGPMGPRKPPRSFHTYKPRGTTSELGGVNYSPKGGHELAGVGYPRGTGSEIGGVNFVPRGTATSELGGSNYIPRGTASEIGGVNYSPRPHVGERIVKSNYMYRPAHVATSEVMGPTHSQPMRQFGMPAGPIYGANNKKRPEMTGSELLKNNRNNGRADILSSNLSKGPQSVKSDALGSNASQGSLRSSINSLDLFPNQNSVSQGKLTSGHSTPTSPQNSQRHHSSNSSSIGSPGSIKNVPPGTPV